MSRQDPAHWSDGYPRPAQRHSETSVAAAESISDRSLGDLHRKVYAYLLRTGGATDEAGINALGMSPSTYRPRRRELELDGFVRDSGAKWKTASGRAAVVWVVTEKGRRA